MYIRNIFLIVFLVSCSSTIKDINYVTFDNTFSNGEKFVLLSCMSSYDKKIHISDFMVKELTSNINSSGLEFNKKTSLCIPKVAINQKGQYISPKFAFEAEIANKKLAIK